MADAEVPGFRPSCRHAAADPGQDAECSLEHAEEEDGGEEARTLLAASVLARRRGLCRGHQGKARSDYIRSLRDDGSMEQALHLLVRCIPETATSEPPSAAPLLDGEHVGGIASYAPASLQWLAKHLYYRTARAFPAAVRAWHAGLPDAALARRVDRFTARSVR